MGLKRFSIYSLIITSLVVIFCVICCFVVIPTPFTFTEMPSKIVVYNYKISSKGETLTSTNSQKENYQIIYDEFVKSSNLSMFQRIVSGANIFEKPTHDVKGIKPTWPTVKGNNATIELTFTNKQHMIVSVDGNTKSGADTRRRLSASQRCSSNLWRKERIMPCVSSTFNFDLYIKSLPIKK